ncbi:maltose/maltodextrin ABC transporter substrate-binding protein MalE [Burkholderiaceae bacterium DAT-1]|nr:maltose/maltodextrin ABC transporter substrate-binding protein MalE [Burkholderiaceae bacterium DAT-1]
MNRMWIKLALMLAAVSAEAAPPTLLVWINGDKAYHALQSVGDDFTAASGIPVRVEHPEDPPPKFQQAAGAGKGPDIFCWAHDRVGEWAKAGLIVPVHPRKAMHEAVDAAAWEAFTWQGKTWGYPLAIEANGLIYNKALVPNPPATWSEVMVLDQQLAKQGKHAILWDINVTFFSWPLLAGTDAFIFARDKQGNYDPNHVGLNTAGAVAAGNVMAEMIDRGALQKGAKYSEMEAGFAQGKIAMMLSGAFAWENARRAGIDFGVAPIPGLKPGQPGRAFVGVQGCMITAPSRNKDLAREFIERWLMQPDALRRMNAEVPLGVPANTAFYAELAQNPLIRATMDNARNGITIPNIPEMGRFWNTMDSAFMSITNRLQSPKDALDNAQARMLVGNGTGH